MTGTLFVVATPIGNLEDITLRGLRVLKEVDVIACEDTRHTRLLLSRHGISTPTLSYHEHNEAARAAQLIARLERGESVALVSDAGMPLLSDPGYPLITSAIAHSIPVIAVPGPSAVTAALAVSGLPADRFLFAGFLPRKAVERRRALEAVSGVPYTLVFFEAPHRITHTLGDLQAVLGNRRIAVVRELTKRFEEVLRGDIKEVVELIGERPARGEFTIVVDGAAAGAGTPNASDAALREHLATLLRSGVTPSSAAKIVTGAHHAPRRTVYRMALELREQGTGNREP
jgi:16S rRNA (cytidine1402-2'-O)-methyltransferase